MTADLLVTFLRDYGRRPLNLVLLLVVPLVFVTLSSGALADFAEILGGLADLGSIEAATAGWAAALLAGIGGFFQVVGSRAADRRLAAAGTGTGAVVAARLVSGFALAMVATAGSLIALGVRAGISDVPRTITITVMFALIYLGLGASVGALAKDELNGSLVVVFIWMFDMFLGPGFSSSHAPVLRLFPTHYPTLVLLDLSSGHSSASTDLIATATWTVASLTLAIWLLVRTTRPLAPAATRSAPPALTRSVVALRYAARQYRRNTVMWVLLAVLPVAFISLSFIITPEQPAAVELVESGRSNLAIISVVAVPGAIMAPITIAFLAGVAGLFVVLGSAQADRRLVLAGFHTPEVLAARLGVIWTAALAVTTVSLAVTFVDFRPDQLVAFVVSNVLIALTYSMIGAILGIIAGRLGGLYLILALPFIDLGIAQNVMFDAAPPPWGRLLPAHGATQLLVDSAFTQSFDTTGALVAALMWLATATAVTAVVFQRLARPMRP